MSPNSATNSYIQVHGHGHPIVYAFPFPQVAAFFKHTDILVAAVNCWFPKSDCAKEFGNKSLATPFPVVIFYPGQQGGVQYRGPLRADLITRWAFAVGASTWST